MIFGSTITLKISNAPSPRPLPLGGGEGGRRPGEGYPNRRKIISGWYYIVTSLSDCMS
jgi:hypothetical protein